MMRKLIQDVQIVNGVCCTAVSTLTPDIVSMKNYQHLTIIVKLKTATGCAAGAITLKQGTSVSTAATALGFSYVWANTDAVASETLTKTSVTSNTFNSAGIALKTEIYVIEVDSDALNVDAGYDCVKVALADMAATTADITYILSQPRYIDQTTHQASITD
jgi:hypothetical protein